MHTPSSIPLDRSSLRPDCRKCFALCCTAFGFSRTADFAVDKPAGTVCPNLAEDFSCSIHEVLQPRGFRGCTVFDCFGAGQHVSRDVFAGRDWVRFPEHKDGMFGAFKVSRQLHEMLWHLAEAQQRTYDTEAEDQAGMLIRLIQEVLAAEVPVLLGVDLGALHDRVRCLLAGVSAEIRQGYAAAGSDHLDTSLHPEADLAGADLRGRSLYGADLRGSCLIAADLRRADLSGADLLGADLRDARLDAADLSRALYLTQAQVNAARGDRGTQLPRDLQLPDNWDGR